MMSGQGILNLNLNSALPSQMTAIPRL